MKAAIQGSGSTRRPAAPAAKVSKAQVVTFAKFGAVVFLLDVIGPKPTLTATLDAAAQLSYCGHNARRGILGL